MAAFLRLHPAGDALAASSMFEAGLKEAVISVKPGAFDIPTKQVLSFRVAKNPVYDPCRCLKGGKI